jgi:hypothetical protein
MTTIVTRAGKGTPLLNTEVDANFTNLNRDKLEVGGEFQSGTANSLVTLNDSKVLTTTNSVNDFGLNAIAQALHRSPNAITAMFIYDTSKDSDGGAWTEKCQHTSWYNEAVTGKWLGAHVSELSARNTNAVLGANIVANGDFSSGATGWTTDGGVTITDGKATFTSSVYGQLRQAPAGYANKTYLYEVDVTIASGTVLFRPNRNSNTGQQAIATSGRYSFYATPTAVDFEIWTATSGATGVSVDNISVREVTALNTSSNDYFQLTTDGKFYRLNKNLLTSTATLATQTQFLTAGTYTFSSTTASSGSVAISGAATASHTAGGAATTFTVATSGSVTFTVTGSVTTAQCELGSTATTYEASGATRITEVFRGNKRDFPRLAGIVAENPSSTTGSVTIYDLTEPGCPMFLRFNSATANNDATTPHWAYRFSTGVTGLAAANGVIGITRSGNGGGVTLANFPLDKLTSYRGSNSYHGLPSREDIASRNTLDQKTTISNPIIAGAGNAVAMTVLPTAPRDPVTGLAVPTIGIATSGGLSVIQDSGTVRNSSSTLAFTSLSLTPQLLTAGRADTTFYYAANPGLLGASFTLTTRTNVQAPDFNIGNTNGLIAPMRSELLRRSATAATVQKLKNFEADPAKALAATITNLFTTGHQPGDIKRTYLADIGEGSVTGPELVTNGGFSNGNTSWTVTGSASAESGQLVFIGGAIGSASQNLNINANRIVRVLINKTVTGTSGLNNVIFSLRSGGANVATFGMGGADGPRIYSVVLAVTSTVDNIAIIYNGTGAFEYKFDNISIKEVVADRSYKAQGAEIYNSVTKTAVATGSQLVAYSNFTDLATDFDVLAVGNDRLFVGSSPLVLQAL